MDTILKFLLHKESSDFLKKNVMFICALSFIVWFQVAYNLYLGNYTFVTIGVILMSITFTIWWLIKYKNTYYTHLTFFVLLPLLIYDTVYNIVQLQTTGALWSYPIILLFFFLLTEKLAWIASALLLLASLITGYFYIPQETYLRFTITLIMVASCTVMVFRNVYAQQQGLEDKINRDPLTRLFNRTTLQSAIEACNANHVTGFNSVILCMDLDHFKHINDTYGHHVGDEVLLGFTKMLQEKFHQQHKIFRMGGEEFLVLVENTTLNDVAEQAESFRGFVESMKILPNQKNITVSIGVAEHTPDERWVDWLKRGDDAMYLAKKTGRNRVIYTWLNYRKELQAIEKINQTSKTLRALNIS